MKYDYRSGIQNKNKSKSLVVIPLLGFIAGGYLLINYLSPSLAIAFGQSPDITAKKLTHEKPALNEDRLYIPQINVNIPIVTNATDTTYEQGARHRKPENGNPKSGGNFILSGTKFSLKLTPIQTRASSPFYYLEQLNEGDQIYADYDGVRYAYSVSKKYKHEQPTLEQSEQKNENKLTLYSSNIQDEQSEGEVIEALPIGTVAWVNGSPKLKSL